MANCGACGTNVGCDCQLRTADNGVRVCGMCLFAYNEKLKTQQPNNENLNFNALSNNNDEVQAPTITKITFNNFQI